MKRIYLGYFVVIIIFLSCNLAQGRYILKSPEASDVSSDGLLHTEVKGDLLSVDIRDVTLNEVLNQLSAQNGVNFLLPPPLGEEKIMVRFSNYEIDKGLKKILSSYDHIFIYTEEESNPHQPLSPRLKEVRIYPRYGDKKGSKAVTASVRNPKTSTPGRESKGKSAERYSKKESAKKRGGKSVGTLSQSLKSKNAKTRLEGVKAFAQMGGVGAIGPLASALQDKNPMVRKEAEKALEDVGENLKEESIKGDEDLEDQDEPTPWGEGEKNLTLAPKGSGNIVNIELSNDVHVRGVQFTLNGANSTSIRTTSRTEGFLARVNEKNGKVVLVSLSGKKIEPGEGPIAEIVCNNPDSAVISNKKIQ